MSNDLVHDLTAALSASNWFAKFTRIPRATREVWSCEVVPPATTDYVVATATAGSKLQALFRALALSTAGVRLITAAEVT